MKYLIRHSFISNRFSHLVASEDPQMEAFTFKQFDAYNEMVAEISQACTYPF